MNKIVNTENAPKAIGPYSQGVIHKDLVYTSGQIAIDPENQEFLGGDIYKETEVVINNIKSILLAAESSLEKVIKVTIYLKNMNDFPIVNKIYEEYFINKPARSTVEVKSLPKDALIEIDCIAYI